MMKWEAEAKGYDCNDCYLAMQNCNDKSICCEDETGLCDWFEELPNVRVESGDVKRMSDRKMIYLDDALEAINHELRCGAIVDQCGLETAYDLIEELPSAQPVFSELCSTELTCEGCKWEKNGNDLCFECCRGCGDMYEERKDNG